MLIDEDLVNASRRSFIGAVLAQTDSASVNVDPRVIPQTPKQNDRGNLSNRKHEAKMENFSCSNRHAVISL
jgi:hypothetical protein